MIEPILTVAVQQAAPGVTVLCVAGEIDHDSRRILHRSAVQRLEAADRRVVIDLSAVTFCDSGGLSLFVELHRQFAAADGWLRLAGAEGMVLGVLKATNLDRMFTLYDSVHAAAHAD